MSEGNGLNKALLILLALGGLYGGLVLVGILPPPWPRPPKAGSFPPPPESQRLRHIYQAMMMYMAQETNWGALPYSAEGEESALYLLKPYLSDQDASLFDAPNADKDVGGPAHWDDTNRKVLGSDYEYANLPVTMLEDETPPEDVVILAERPGVRSGLRWFFLSYEWSTCICGDPKHPQYHERLAGKVRQPVKTPEGKTVRTRFVEWRRPDSPAADEGIRE